MIKTWHIVALLPWLSGVGLDQEKQTVIVDAIVMNAYTNELLQGVEVISLESNVSETSGANGEAILKIPRKDVQWGVLHIRKIKSGYQTEDEWVGIANKATFLKMKPNKVVAPTNVRATNVEERQSYAAAPTEDISSLLKLYTLVERSARLAGDNPSRALIYAVEAGRLASSVDPSNYAAENALRAVLQQPVPTQIFESDSAVRFADFSRNGSEIFGVSGQKSVTVWNAASGRVLRSDAGHNDTITGATFSPDGTRILTCSLDQTARIVPIDHRPAVVLTGHSDGVDFCAFSPDGSRVITASRDRSARIWNAKTGEVLAILGHGAPVTFGVFSPDGSSVLTGSLDSRFSVWNARTGAQEYSRLLSFQPGTGGFSPTDGEEFFLASAKESSVDIWHATGNVPFIKFPWGGLPLCATTYSRQGDKLLISTLGITSVWNLRDHAVVTFSSPIGGATASDIDPSGELVAVGHYDGTVGLFNAASGANIRSYQGHEQEVSEVRFSPDGLSLMTAGFDGTIRLWSTGAPEDGPTFHFERAPFTGIAACPKMHFLAVSDSAHSILVIDDRTGRKVKTLTAESGSRSMAIDSEGKVLAGVGEDGMIRLWDLSSGKLRWKQDLGLNTSGITFDTSGTKLAAWQTSWPGRVVIWDVASGRSSYDKKMGFQKRSPGLSYVSDISPSAAQFSPDGKLLLIATDNVSALDLETGNILFDLEANGVRQIEFNHVGTLVATGEFNGTIRLWDVKTSREKASLPGQHFPLSSLSFSQDDRLLLTTSFDGSARVWDCESGREISQLLGHRNAILGGTFSPQGDRVVTASMDSTARIWDTKTGENLGYIANSNSEMLFSSYTQNADHIITVSADGTVAIHAAGIKELLELAEKELTNVMTVRPSGRALTK